MALIDLVLQSGPRFRPARPTSMYRPRFEPLETRELLAVAAPIGLLLTVPAPTQVKLTWTDVANESGYRILRWDGMQPVLAGIVERNVTTFTVNGLLPNTVQWFSIESFDNATSARSTWASIKTPPDTITAPAHVRVSSTTLTQATLTWNDVNNETGYRIFQWNGTSAVQVGTADRNANFFSVKDLTPGTTYYFYVQAFNATNSASSDWVSGTTQAVFLTSPGNVKAVAAGPSTINLTWTDVANERGYRVYQWNGVSGAAPVLVATLAANATGYQAAGLTPARTYSYFVQAFNGANTANSTWVQATTTGAPLQGVTQLTAVATGPSTVQLTWTEPARAVGYRIYLWTGTTWSPSNIFPRGTTTVTIGGLYSNRSHWFLVEAFTENFTEVAYSNRVWAQL